MKEYAIAAKETTSGTFYIRANSREEAMEKFEEMTTDGGYRDMMDEVESFYTEIVKETVIDGEDYETGYIKEMDMTVIIKYVYKSSVPIMEQIVGYYHGKPNDADTEKYKNSGVVGVMI